MTDINDNRPTVHSPNKWVLIKLENMLRPAPSPNPAEYKLDASGKEYWQAGEIGFGPTALTKSACEAEEDRRISSARNDVARLSSIPWC